MRYPANETAQKHERILDEAARLFRERGFAGAGVAEIMKAAGLTHGAFYAHFPSKEALAAEALTRAFDRSQEWSDTVASVSGDAKEAYLDGYLSRAHRDAPGGGCAIAALGPEVARDPAVRAPFTQAIKRMLDRMAERFRFKRKAPPRDNAIHLLSAVVGALVLARAVDDPELSQEILKTVRDGLKAM